VLCDSTGKVFVGLDTPQKMENLLAGMASQYGISLTGQQLKTGRSAANIGVPMDDLTQFLSLEDNELNKFQETRGIPTDSIKGGMSEFQTWIQTARDDNGSDMKLAIKAAASTPYGTVKKIMSELQDMNENRYYLITSYKKLQEE